MSAPFTCQKQVFFLLPTVQVGQRKGRSEGKEGWGKKPYLYGFYSMYYYSWDLQALDIPESVCLYMCKTERREFAFQKWELSLQGYDYAKTCFNHWIFQEESGCARWVSYFGQQIFSRAAFKNKCLINRVYPEHRALCMCLHWRGWLKALSSHGWFHWLQWYCYVAKWSLLWLRAVTSHPKAAMARPQNMVKVSSRTVKVTLTALAFSFFPMTSISLLLSSQVKMRFFSY